LHAQNQNQQIMKNNLKTAVLALAVCIALLTGCAKNNASIVGVWSFNTERQVIKTAGVTTHDTTVNVPAGATLTFGSKGQFYTYNPPSNYSNGTYTLSGDKLTITTSGSPIPLLVTSLTDGSLQFEQRDTDFTPPIHHLSAVLQSDQIIDNRKRSKPFCTHRAAFLFKSNIVRGCYQ
jgi:hypothetical protein